MPRISFAHLPAFALVALVVFAGCGSQNDTTPKPTMLTYWDDVAPVLHAKCAPCHQAGGIAPFALDSFESAKTRAQAAADVTRRGIMPPYLVTHDGTCGDFDDAETLTETGFATLDAWAKSSAKLEGKPVTLTRPPVPALAGTTGLRTPTLAPRPQGGNLAEHDEYRCFPVESTLERDAYITGYQVLPGNPALVHHVIVFVIDPTAMRPDGRTNAEVMKALDDQDPDRPGWPCFGMAGEGLEPDSAPVVWAPGQGVLAYPPKMGLLQRKTDQLVVQLHYNLSDSRLAGQTDSTTIRLRHADSVERRIVFLVEDGLLDTLFGPEPAQLAPGNRSVSYSWKSTGAELGLDTVPYADLIGIMPHMHERGVRKELRLGGAGKKMSCAARVERWDFHWQKMYMYQGTPPRLDASSELELSCEYDTSRDRMPVLPGWGTRNEMCTAILMLALPPGIGL